MEIEITDKKDKIRQLERTNAETSNQLDCIYEEQEQMRVDLEAQLRQRIEQRDSEIRKMKLDIQQIEHKATTELDNCKERQRQELEIIQEKVQAALNKKKEVIEQLQEELRIKDLHIAKLKEVMDRQRHELVR